MQQLNEIVKRFARCNPSSDQMDLLNSITQTGLPAFIQQEITILETLELNYQAILIKTFKNVLALNYSVSQMFVPENYLGILRNSLQRHSLENSFVLDLLFALCNMIVDPPMCATLFGNKHREDIAFLSEYLRVIKINEKTLPFLSWFFCLFFQSTHVSVQTLFIEAYFHFMKAFVSLKVKDEVMQREVVGSMLYFTNQGNLSLD